MRIAIDAMGGDHAPQMNVEGALAAAVEWKDTELILVGDEKVIRPLITSDLPNLRVQHASEVITSEDEPVRAVRRKKDSSLVVAGQLVKQGEADAMISAGNTGALMAVGLLVTGRIPGIDRPALAPILPTMDGAGVLSLDLGANMDATAEHLVQYAVMGSIFRHKVHGIASPRVGLLNVGSEATKGNELTKSAYPLLERAKINFVGNVEARDVMQGVCDVLVCDGFSGNILLKAMEGTAEAIIAGLRSEFKQSIIRKLCAAVLKPGIKNFMKRLDYTEHGAAPLLGVGGVCMKSHGSSNAHAIRNAVRQARIAVLNDLVPSITAELREER